MNLNPKSWLRSYINRCVARVMREQIAEVAALRTRLDELNHVLRFQCAELATKVGTSSDRIDAWGEELAKLGHLGHERANAACEDAQYARDALEGVLDKLAVVSRSVGDQLTRIDDRLLRVEVAMQSGERVHTPV